MFNDPEEYKAHMLRQADAIEQNGLALAKQRLQDAKNGKGYDQFIRINHISKEWQKSEWENHLRWLEGQVRNMERKVRSLRRKAETV